MKVYRISISIYKHWEMTKQDDKTKESDGGSHVQNYQEWGCCTWRLAHTSCVALCCT